MIKKTLTAAALVLLTMSANAERWIHVLDGTNGTRMIVDAESFTEAAGDDGDRYLAASFRYVSEGKFLAPFIFVIEKASCKTGGGQLFSRVIKNGKWVTRDTYFWSDNGTKMYDSGAKALCLMQEVVDERAAPTKGSRAL